MITIRHNATPRSNRGSRGRPIRAMIASAGLALALALSSCGFVNVGSNDPDVGEGGGTLSLTLSTEQNTGLKELLPEFEKESGATVKIKFASVKDLNEQIRIQLNSGTADDIFKVSPGASSPVAAKVLAASDDLRPLAGGWTKDLNASTKSLSEIDGEQLAFPLGQNALVMGYNMDVFDELGLKPPTTWSEFLGVCAELKAAGKTPVAAGFTGGITLQFWIYALAASLVYADNPDIDTKMAAGETSFAKSAEWQQVFTQFKTLQDQKYLTDGSLGVSGEEAMKTVGKGDAAMVLTAASAIPELQGYAGESKIGVFVLPGTDNPEQTRVPVAPDFIGVNAATKQDKLAEQLFEFLAKPENVTKYAQSAGMLPGLAVEGVQGAESAEGLLTYIENDKSVAYANYLWPNADTQQTLLQSGQDFLTGKITLAELTERLDADYAKGTG